MSDSYSACSLCDLFPPASSISEAPDLKAPYLALIGKLPSSAILRFALNHLKRQEEESYSAERIGGLSEKAKGKRKQVEEDFAEDGEGENSDLEEGDIEKDRIGKEKVRQRHVLVLTPNLPTLRQQLIDENDVSLFGRKRDAGRASLLDRITFKQLPSSAQLTYFLASCYDLTNPNGPDIHSTYTSGSPQAKEDPSYLPFEATLVILYSPSSYLEEPVHQGCGIESYASLLALFVSNFSNLSQLSPQIVLIDPAADSLSLPIIPLHLRSSRKRQKQSEGDTFGGARQTRYDDDADDVDRLPLRTVIDRFFGCIGEIVAVPLSPTALEFGHSKRWRIDVRTKYPATYSFLEFNTQRVGSDDDEGDQEGGTRITVEG